MPIYEFACDGCGPFTAWRSMAESQAPAMCDSCGAPAARVLSASNVNRKGSGRQRIVEPHLVAKKPDSRPPPAPVNTHTHGRPWMMGH